MKNFQLYVFLMVKASGQSICNHFLETGYAINPLTADGTIYTKSAASAVLCVKISRKAEISTDELSAELKAFLTQNNIPYYGYHLQEEETWGSTTSPGWFPEVEEKTPIAAGPYRTSAMIIPFPAPPFDRK